MIRRPPRSTRTDTLFPDTTLFRSAGLDLQTRGTIEQAGRDISALPIAERDFGIVFQSYALFPNLTIERNVAFGLENSGRSKAEITARVSELLDLVGLADQPPKRLEERRVGKECDSTYRYQLTTYPIKKKQIIREKKIIKMT